MTVRSDGADAVPLAVAVLVLHSQEWAVQVICFKGSVLQVQQLLHAAAQQLRGVARQALQVRRCSEEVVIGLGQQD